MDSLNQALIWIEQSNALLSDEPVITDMTEERYVQCISFLQDYANPYSIICSGYISFTRGKWDVQIDGTTVTFKLAQGSNNTAFNDIIREANEKDVFSFISEFNPVKISKANKDILEGTSIQDGYICYDLNSNTLAPFFEIAEKQWNATKTLPDTWEFDKFNLEDYKRVWVAITAICYIHFTCCSKIVDPLIRLKNELINLPYETFAKAISDLSKIKIDVVKCIINYITYEPTKKNVDIMYQPIVLINRNTILITPFLFMGSNPERNLLAVVCSQKDNKHSKQVNNLEDLMVHEIEKTLLDKPHLQIIKRKKLGGRLPDIDFGIYDRMTQSVLLCELKWFIAADSTKEVYAREDDVTHGCEQMEQIMTYAMSSKESFMKQVFGIDDCSEIDLFCCVVTKHNIRTQNNHVPVINLSKLKDLFLNKPANIVFHLIRNHEYEDPLPLNAEITYQNVEYGGFTFKLPAIKFESLL